MTGVAATAAILGGAYFAHRYVKAKEKQASATAAAAANSSSDTTETSTAMKGNAEDQEVDSATKQALNEQEEYRKRLRGIRSTYAGSTAMNSGGTSGATTGSASTLG